LKKKINLIKRSSKIIDNFDCIVFYSTLNFANLFVELFLNQEQKFYPVNITANTCLVFATFLQVIEVFNDVGCINQYSNRWILLTYWLVNTIRHQLKQAGINSG
jgi:hypothetical protein